MGGMGGLMQPIPGVGKPAGRAMADIMTLGTAELLPSNIKDPLFNGMGSVFWSPASLMAAGGAGLAGAGGIGGGGFGAAAPGAAGIGTPAAGSSAIGSALGTGQAAGGGAKIGAGAATPPGGMSKSDMLQNAFLATSIGGMLGNAITPPPPPATNIPSASVGGGGGFTPVANNASQQWAQLMAQRRAQQLGKFTV